MSTIENSKILQHIRTKSDMPLGTLNYQCGSLIRNENESPDSDLQSMCYAPLLSMRIDKETRQFHLNGLVLYQERFSPSKNFATYNILDKTILCYLNFEQRDHDHKKKGWPAVWFNMVFDTIQYESLKGSTIYVTCVYGDPEESSTSQMKVEDVDEI